MHQAFREVIGPVQCTNINSAITANDWQSMADVRLRGKANTKHEARRYVGWLDVNACSPLLGSTSQLPESFCRTNFADWL